MIIRNAAHGETAPVLSIKAARQYLGGIGRATLYRIMEAGGLESTHIGGRRMVLRSSLDALIEQAKVTK